MFHYCHTSISYGGRPISNLRFADDNNNNNNGNFYSALPIQNFTAQGAYKSDTNNNNITQTQTHRQTDRQTDRHTHTHTDTHTDTQTQTQTQTHTDTHRHTHTQKKKQHQKKPPLNSLQRRS